MFFDRLYLAEKLAEFRSLEPRRPVVKEEAKGDRLPAPAPASPREGEAKGRPLPSEA